MWERNLEEYRHTLHHLPESRDPSNPILESASMGREQIISSLMNINTRYEKLLNEVQLIMEDVVDNLKRQGKEHKEVRFLSRRGLVLLWCRWIWTNSKPKVSTFELGALVLPSASRRRQWLAWVPHAKPIRVKESQVDYKWFVTSDFPRFATSSCIFFALWFANVIICLLFYGTPTKTNIPSLVIADHWWITKALGELAGDVNLARLPLTGLWIYKWTNAICRIVD